MIVWGEVLVRDASITIQLILISKLDVGDVGQKTRSLIGTQQLNDFFRPLLRIDTAVTSLGVFGRQGHLAVEAVLNGDFCCDLQL